MPSIGGPYDPDAGRRRADIILGDCFASSCNEMVISMVENTFTALGYKVARNKPFAGGFTTRNYGHPKQGRHALQIEINRALYMDETLIKKNEGMAQMTYDISAVIHKLTGIVFKDLLPD